jgi:hypothetical protein
LCLVQCHQVVPVVELVKVKLVLFHGLVPGGNDSMTLPPGHGLRTIQ